jgi:hypothetical protein
MAYVHEPYAADYRFTSALPSQILRTLAPVLQPLVRRAGCAPADPRAPASAQDAARRGLVSGR